MADLATTPKRPTPWAVGLGYEQCDPGHYIHDASGLVVVADTEGTLDIETADMIVQAVNAAHPEARTGIRWPERPSVAFLNGRPFRLCNHPGTVNFNDPWEAHLNIDFPGNARELGEVEFLARLRMSADRTFVQLRMGPALFVHGQGHVVGYSIQERLDRPGPPIARLSLRGEGRLQDV